MKQIPQKKLWLQKSIKHYKGIPSSLNIHFSQYIIQLWKQEHKLNKRSRRKRIPNMENFHVYLNLISAQRVTKNPHEYIYIQASCSFILLLCIMLPHASSTVLSCASSYFLFLLLLTYFKLSHDFNEHKKIVFFIFVAHPYSS